MTATTLSFFLLILARSNYDHYARECDFGILKKTKQNKNKKKTAETVYAALSFSLSLLVSLKLEHYTRECEFRNFDKIKKQKKQNNTTKHKNLWLNFCLNKECPKLLCGLGIGHRRRQTIPMRNSSVCLITGMDRNGPP